VTFDEAVSVNTGSSFSRPGGRDQR
jgi:hypothetical protein